MVGLDVGQALLHEGGVADLLVDGGRQAQPVHVCKTIGDLVNTHNYNIISLQAVDSSNTT